MSGAQAPWTLGDAERHLASLELFGMRFGVERMRELMRALGDPQRRYATIHVVGSNGKSSTTRMIAAILAAHGMRTGAYMSPHLVSITERIRIDDADIAPDLFASAVQRAAAAAQQLNAEHAPDDRVTQFELLTAAAYVALAEANVEVGVIEAGLGGRYDATNVIESRVQVLTNVSLEHTRWLGPTVAHIAAEKLAIVPTGDPPPTLVVGAGLHPDALALAEQAPARLVLAPADPGDVVVHAAGAFQRRNFALAMAAAQAFLGALDPAAVRRAAETITVPGRLQVIATEPLTVVDGAHNPDGVAVMLDSLGELAGERKPVAVVSVLDDKDAAGMLAQLGARCQELVMTATASARSLPPATLLSLNRQLGGPPATTERDPLKALALARAHAGPDGVVLVTGSLTLVAAVVA